MKTLCVGNFPVFVTDETLRKRFEAYGELMSFEIFRGAIKGVAVVEYMDVKAAREALRREDGTRMEGHTLCVSEYHG